MLQPAGTFRSFHAYDGFIVLWKNDKVRFWGLFIEDWVQSENEMAVFRVSPRFQID